MLTILKSQEREIGQKIAIDTKSSNIRRHIHDRLYKRTRK